MAGHEFYQSFWESTAKTHRVALGGATAKVLILARQEAVRCGRREMSPEDLLVGILKGLNLTESAAACLLDGAGLDLQKVRDAVEAQSEILPSWLHPDDEMVFIPEQKERRPPLVRNPPPSDDFVGAVIERIRTAAQDVADRPHTVTHHPPRAE